MIPTLLRILLIAVTIQFASGQCLTDYKKLISDQTPSYSEAFGYEVKVKDDLLVIGAPFSDTLGFNGAGIIYLYQRLGSSWQYLGVLRPSDPSDALNFGTRIQVTQNYIIVGCGAAKKKVYLFKRPVSGWQTSTETLILAPPNTNGFGNMFHMATDEQTLVVADLTYLPSNGAVFVYHRMLTEEWSDAHLKQIILNPEPSKPWFASGGVQVLGNRIAVHNIVNRPNEPVQIFNDASGSFGNFILEAALPLETTTTGSYGPSFVFNAEGIIRYRDKQFHFYNAPANGTWTNQGPSCSVPFSQIDGEELESFFHVNYDVSGENIYVTAKLKNGSSKLVKIRKAGITWCEGFTLDVIQTEPAPSENGSGFPIRSISADGGSQVAYSWISSQESLSPTSVAVGVFNKEPDNTWKKQALYKSALSAEDYRFGTGLYYTGNYLFSSATGERVLDLKPRGAVYIFKKDGAGNFQKIKKLSISPLKDSDQSFGSTITGYGDYVAISAYGYDPDRILIYKGANGDFSNPTLVQTLLIPTGKAIESYGYMKMNDNWLVVPCGTNGTDGPRLKLLLFKRSGDQWTYTEEINLGSMFVLNKNPPALDMDDNTIVATSSYKEVSVIRYEPTTQKWSTVAKLIASDPDHDPFFSFPVTIDGSQFGFEVKLTKDHIFVAAPAKNFGSTPDVGAIYVYQRYLTGVFTTRTESVKLLPENKEASTFFGYSLDVRDNTLITGASRTGHPGKAFVLQALDYQWSNTVQLLTLEGDTFKEDWFGRSVILSQDHFFISATREHQAQSISAGAVYMVTPPPLIKLEPPVCKDAAPFKLKGYPFNGTWSGPGIVDAESGMFNPQLAGEGVRELTYTTPNCHFPGKQRLQVVSSDHLLPTSPSSHVVCKEGTRSVVLSVVQDNSFLYSWFHRVQPNAFVRINNANTHQLTTKNGGEYKVEMSKFQCVKSQTFTVSTQEQSIKLDPIPTICDRSNSILPLTADPQGGNWTITPSQTPSPINQQKRQLDISKMDNGVYTLSYNYTSIEGCKFGAQQQVIIQNIKTPVLGRSGNLCNDGKVLLESMDTANVDAYQWLFSGTNTNETASFESTEPSFTIYKNGTYTLRVKNKYGCAASSLPLLIDDKFSIKVLPEGISFSVCPIVPFSLMVEQPRAGDVYHWYHSPTQTSGKLALNVIAPEMEIAETGFYEIRAERGACVYTSAEKFVEVQPGYELYAPNIFTPNGDAINDNFVISLNYEQPVLQVFTRSGSKVFESTTLPSWDGAGASAGIYFWRITYRDCKSQRHEARGWVQLMR